MRRQTASIMFILTLFCSATAIAAPGDVADRVPLTFGHPTGITWTGSAIWVADRRTDLFYEIDPATGNIIREMETPGKQGNVPGLDALRNWQKALPDLPDGIELPRELAGRRIKDVNDLDQHPEGKRIFKRLTTRWGLKIKKL